MERGHRGGTELHARPKHTRVPCCVCDPAVPHVRFHGTASAAPHCPTERWLSGVGWAPARGHRDRHGGAAEGSQRGFCPFDGDCAGGGRGALLPPLLAVGPFPLHVPTISPRSSRCHPTMWGQRCRSPPRPRHPRSHRSPWGKVTAAAGLRAPNHCHPPPRGAHREHRAVPRGEAGGGAGGTKWVTLLPRNPGPNTATSPARCPPPRGPGDKALIPQPPPPPGPGEVGGGGAGT